MFENITREVIRERVPALTEQEVEALYNLFCVASLLVAGARQLGTEGVMKVIDVLPVQIPVPREQLAHLVGHCLQTGDASILGGILAQQLFGGESAPLAVAVLVPSSPDKVN